MVLKRRYRHPYAKAMYSETLKMMAEVNNILMGRTRPIVRICLLESTGASGLA